VSAQADVVNGQVLIFGLVLNSHEERTKSSFMSDNTTDDSVHEFTMYLVKGTSGKLIGHIKEVPEIIVQADTEVELDQEATKSVSLFFQQYPEVHDRLFPYEAPHKKSATETYRHSAFLHKLVEVPMR
jgi:uncharacterized Zn finger protein